MATTTEVSKGVIYTEGFEYPNLGADVVGTAPTKASPTPKAYTVQFRPFRLQEDGNDYSKSTKSYTWPTP